MRTAGSWLKQWDVLERLTEPLHHLPPSRDRSAWTIGPPEDAVAVALAFRHAWSDPAADFVVYLTTPREPQERLQFRLADVRCLPDGRRDAAFVHRDRYWVPSDRITRRVVLHTPRAPVDVVTVRTQAGNVDSPDLWEGTVRPALDGLRKHGRALFDSPPPERLLGRGFRAVDGSDRLFERTTGPAAPPGGTEDDPPATLADRLEQFRLIESHVNLARSLARRFSHYGDGEDLEQVAMMALIRAAGRFRPEKGFAFATYATASILGELKRHFRDRTWGMRVPRSVQETYLAVRNARDVLGQRLKASPTVQQIAEHLGISDEAVLMAMEAGDNYSLMSLDAPSRDGDGDGGGVELPVEDPGMELALNRRQLELALPTLGADELYLIKRLYFDGRTQKQVSAEIGVSQMQVSRLAARVLAKLRAQFEVAG